MQAEIKGVRLLVYCKLLILELDMIRTCLLSCILALPAVTLADHSTDLALEPSINGEVSRLGTFPSQKMADEIHAYLEWRAQSGSPYYLFQVAADRLTPADGTQ
jgi:hypothetical protein